MKDEEKKNEVKSLKQKGTDIQQLLADLHGGLFERKLSHIMSQAGLAVLEQGDQNGSAKIIVTFELKKVSQGRQMKLDHSINYIIPTMNGQKLEKDKTNTIIYVNEGGNITIAPESQQSFTFKE